MKRKFKAGEKYWGNNFSVFRTVKVPHERGLFVDANVLIGGKMITGTYPKKRAKTFFDMFEREYNKK